MALIKRWGDEATGLEQAEAYHKVNGIILDYVGKQAQFTVLVYRDAAARQAGKDPFLSRNFAVRNVPASESPDGEAHADFDDLFTLAVLEAEGVNPVAQAYKWLKQQPLYSGAQDA